MSDHQPSQKELPEAPSTATTPAGITRRGFLKGAGITAAGCDGLVGGGLKLVGVGLLWDGRGRIHSGKPAG